MESNGRHKTAPIKKPGLILRALGWTRRLKPLALKGEKGEIQSETKSDGDVHQSPPSVFSRHEGCRYHPK